MLLAKQIFYILRTSYATVSNCRDEMERFKGRLLDYGNNCEVRDAIDIIAFVRTIEDLPKAGPTWRGVLDTALAAGAASDFLVRNGGKIQEYYEPVVSSYSQLCEMENANRNASFSRCEKEGYRPNLEFHPEIPLADPNRSALIDKNNPNSHQIIIPVS